jgi:hypothetical protein
VEVTRPVHPTRLGLVLLAIAILSILVWFLVLILFDGGRFSVEACVTHQPLSDGPANLPASVPLLPGWLPWPVLMLAACFAGFLGGSTWGHRRGWRHAQKHAPNEHRSSSASPISMGAPSTVVQASLVVLFAVGVVALLWETFAVSHVVADPTRWPITYFVRCADDVLPFQTLAVSVVVSTLVGHWLGTYGASR